MKEAIITVAKGREGGGQRIMKAWRKLSPSLYIPHLNSKIIVTTATKCGQVDSTPPEREPRYRNNNKDAYKDPEKEVTRPLLV